MRGPVAQDASVFLIYDYECVLCDTLPAYGYILEAGLVCTYVLANCVILFELSRSLCLDTFTSVENFSPKMALSDCTTNE